MDVIITMTVRVQSNTGNNSIPGSIKENPHGTLCRRRVKEWRWWVCLISLAIAAVTAFIGVFAAAYGSELLNKAF